MKLRKSFWLALVMAIPLAADWALAANCGDTSGRFGRDVPCRCGDTVTTRTRLGSGDPVISTGPGDFCPGPANFALEVGPGVTLDLNGREIRGDLGTTVAGGGLFVCGIAIAGNGAAVGNGFISRTHVGVCNHEGYDATTVRSIKLSDVTLGIQMVLGSGHRIHRNEVKLDRFTTALGTPQAGGISLIQTQSSTVSENVIVGRRALSAIGVSGEGNVVVDNSSALGPIFVAGSGSTIARNEVTGGFFTGPSVFIIGDSNTIRQNRTVTSGDRGIGVLGNGNNVQENVCIDGVAGLTVDGTGNTLTNNTSTKSYLGGITVKGGNNIDGGGNSGSEGYFFPQVGPLVLCSIDGAPCAP